MPRAAAVAVENSFKNGLITEASSMNFPENACTETENCVFSFDGSVQRRLGIDFEPSYALKTIDRADSVVCSYVWKNVAGDGDTTVVVVQVGGTIYFYETTEGALSDGAVATTITLSTYLASGAVNPGTKECQFANGNGLLFVAHPDCSPFYVSYNTSTNTATGTALTLSIRDFEGDTADSNAVDTRPTATYAGLNVNHKYNLHNQGWTVAALTTVSNNWDGANTTMPSNADIMWAYKDSSDDLDFRASQLSRVFNGNSPAPKGFYIMTVWLQDRDAISGLSGTTDTTSGSARPSTVAFFAGRTFFSGINYSGFNSKVYFSQIVERVAQYGQCYQANDPTAEEAFDLLPADGGVISIPEAGTIYKLVSISGALIAFAANGVWAISGSTGLGFTAVDYTVSKISSIATISASSFVDVGGYPSWWNNEGIYLLTTDGQSPKIESLSDTKIRQYLATIPSANKRYVRGYFNAVEGVVQWLISTSTNATPEEHYSYDTILNFNVLTGAFYPWTISASAADINSIVVIDSEGGASTINQVQNDAGDNVQDDAGSNVITYSIGTSGAVAPSFKYLVSYDNGASYSFTWAEANNTDYLDWDTYGTDVDYESYFISGYRLRGDAIKKWQTNWIKIHSRNDEPTSYNFRGLWDFANTNDSGRWSSSQLVEHSNSEFDTMMRRLKVRGHGIALQYKVTSETGLPFDILGWSALDTANAMP
mgnify:FL=1